VSKKNPFSTGKRGIIAHYCAIPLSQPPFIAYNIAQYISPTTPFIAIKYWQYLVRAKRKGACSIDGWWLEEVGVGTPIHIHIYPYDSDEQALRVVSL